MFLAANFTELDNAIEDMFTAALETLEASTLNSMLSATPESDWAAGDWAPLALPHSLDFDTTSPLDLIPELL